jgi:hypothetical protein
MSRSTKKEPHVSDYSRGYTSFAKRQASRKVRYYKGEIKDGCYFKKLYPSYNIFDYSWIVFVHDEVKKYPELTSDETWFTTYQDLKTYLRK